jgi:hypothetical protein
MKLVVVVIIAFLLAGIILFLYTDDSHRTNLRYLLWKAGWLRFSPEVSLRYFGVDVEFRDSLVGQTREEIKVWFPDLRPIAQANSQQRYYEDDVRDTDFMWIGDSHWGIEFENGRVKRFRVLKG